MDSIPKIVLTPVKWASKRLLKSLLHATLLRFPGGDSHDPIACTYCPEMCRFACPTAVASGDDTVTPCNKMSLLHKESRWPGQAAQGGPLWPLYDCTGCGRCTDYCVYGMPVAEQLFAARGQYGWDAARAVQYTDEEDLCGDLAEELGDLSLAAKRLSHFESRGGEVYQVREPKALHSLLERGVKQARLSWGEPRHVDPLRGKTWLVLESAWLSRRLERSEEVAGWIAGLERQGIQFVWPFHRGRDCIDAGGEGAHTRLFPKTAERMARDVWERDGTRAQGVLCFSARQAAHLRSVLNTGTAADGGVPVICFEELS